MLIEDGETTSMGGDVGMIDLTSLVTHDDLVIFGSRFENPQDGAVRMFRVNYETRSAECVARFTNPDAPTDLVYTSWGVGIGEGLVAITTDTRETTGETRVFTRAPVTGVAIDERMIATPCNNGKYQPNVAQPLCLDVPAGYYTPDDGKAHTTALPCHTGQYQPQAGKTGCIKVTTPGYYVPADGKPHAAQIECATGHYAGTTSSCVACAAGSFASTPRQASCTPASPGHHVPAAGAVAQTQCPAGTIGPGTGLTKCTECNTGQYQPQAGQTKCVASDANFFVPPTGSHMRQYSCAAGKISGAKSSSCLVPGKGSIVVDGKIVNCNNGQYQPTAGQTACLTCPAFSMCPDDGQPQDTHEPCPIGTYSLEGEAYCYPASPGSIITLTPERVVCNGGQFQSRSKQKFFCRVIGAPNNFYVPSDGKPHSRALPCPYGKVSNANCDACVDAPADTFYRPRLMPALFENKIQLTTPVDGNMQFGRQVSISPDGFAAVVSAPYARVDGSVPNGMALILTRVSRDAPWIEQQMVSSGHNNPTEFGGSLALTDAMAVIGASYQNYVHIFMKPDTGWGTPVPEASHHKITVPGEMRFGTAVNVDGDGDIIVTAAKGIYIISGTSLTVTQSIFPAWIDPSRSWFGPSIAIDGNTLAVSDAVFGYRGRVAIYINRGPSYAPSKYIEDGIIDNPKTTYDRFGISLSMSGGLLAIGAPKARVDFDKQGVVYIYQRGSEGWAPVDRITSEFAELNHLFGFRVELTAQFLAIVAQNQISIFHMADDDIAWMMVADIPVPREFDEPHGSIAVTDTDLVVGQFSSGDITSYLYRDEPNSDSGSWVGLDDYSGHAVDGHGIAVPCDGGTYQPYAGMPACIPITEAGQYTLDDGKPHLAPEQCGKGWYSPAKNAACLPCNNGTYQDTIGADSCKSARKGRYVAQTVGAVIADTLCPTGSFTAATGQNSCTPAAVGYFSTGTSQEYCPRGKYQDEIGKASCKDPDAGYYVPAPGHLGPHPEQLHPPAGFVVSSPTGYVEVLKGSIAVNGVSMACSGGQYQDLNGQTACKVTPAGHYNPVIQSGGYAGNVAPFPCPAGTATNDIGQTACTPCNSGRTRPVRARRNALQRSPGNTSSTAMHRSRRSVFVPPDRTQTSRAWTSASR